MPRDIIEVLEALSSLSRTGWMLRGVPHEIAETVSDHSYWAAFLAFEISVLLNKNGVSVNPYKASLEALFHDVAESVIGDIPKTAGISSAKDLAESRALEDIPISLEAKNLVKDFIAGASNEAIVAKVADILATIIRAQLYVSKGYARVIEIKNNLIKNINSLIESVEWKNTLRSVLREISGLEL